MLFSHCFLFCHFKKIIKLKVRISHGWTYCLRFVHTENREIAVVVPSVTFLRIITVYGYVNNRCTYTCMHACLFIRSVKNGQDNGIVRANRQIINNKCAQWRTKVFMGPRLKRITCPKIRSVTSEISRLALEPSNIINCI